jgi:hypothetical protein
MVDDYDLVPGDSDELEATDEPLDAEEIYRVVSEAEAAEQEMPGMGQADASSTATVEPSALGDTERLRQPRAQGFRRRLRTQIGMLPLAVFLLALGGYLIARRLDVKGIPDFSTVALWGGSVLALAFAAVFHALVFGRRESGLLFAGLLIWITAGLAALLILGIDEQAQATQWWPLLLVALSVTFLVTYLIERVHDVRLVLASILTLVAGATAYLVTSGRVDNQLLDRAADYWPLLLAVIGVGLLPLAFHRRAE